MEDYNNSSYYSANPETLSYLNTNSSNFETTTNEMEQQNPPPSSSSNMVSKSKYGWVEVIGNDSNVYVFSRAIVNDLTGKFELFQDETMRLVIFTVILGHPKILVAIIKDVVYLRSLTESCAFKCDSVEEAQSWGKFLCYPMFSPVPITKSSECDWLYENNNSSRGGGGGGASLSSLTPLEEQELFMNNNTPRGGAGGGGKQTELLHHLARQQIQFKIAEMTRKQKLKQAEKKKIKIQQLKKSRHQQVLKQRAERIENNPNMKRKLNSYRHRYDNISEIFRHQGGGAGGAGAGGGGAAGTKPLPPPPVLTSGQRELELSKQKRLARQNYENTLQILIENREQILKNEMEIMKFKLQEERQHQHEYSEQKLLEELLSHTKNGQLMTPTKQFEQMCSIVKIQALWRGATTRNYLENKRALMEIQEEILSTIESAQKFQTIFHNDSVYGGGDVGGGVGGGSDVGDGENENERRRSGAPPLSASVGTLTSQAMKSLKELGYDIPSYFYSPSKPHERGGSFQSSQSFRKGVTYYDPNEHQNFMNNTQLQHHQQQQQQSQQQQQQSSPPSNSSNYPTMQPRPPNKSSSPSKYSQTLHNPYTSTNHPTTSQHQQTQPYNFSKTSPSSSYHLNYSSNKSDHLTSPTSDTRRVVNKSPYPSNSTVSMSTYDHSSINPNGWSGYEMSNERNSIYDPQQQHHPHHPHHHQTHHTSPPTMISESQRLKLLTPVAENKSVKSNDSFNSPNYYLDRHYETSGLYASGTQQQFASTSTVLSDLTDHDFGEGKAGGGGSGGVIYTVEVDVSTPSSHSSQSFPQISPNQGNEQDGDGKKTNPPSNSNKPTRNSILLPQKVITNQSTEANQTSSRSSSTSPRNNSILAPSSNQRQPSDNGPNQSQSQSQSHAQGQDQGQGQGQSQPQPQLQPQQQPPAQAPPNTTTNNNNVPSQRKSIVASSQSQSQNNSPIIDTPTVTSTSRKSFITPQAPQVEKITSQSTVNSTTPSNQRKSILTPQVQPNPYPYFQDQAVTTIINNPSSRKSILSPQPPKGQNELELKPNGQETRQGVGSESLPSSRTEIPSNPSNLSNLSNQRTGENNANTNGISNINPDALTYMNTRMNSQQTVGNLSNNESSDTTDKQNLDSSSNSRPNTLKKSQSVKSTGSSRSSVSKKSQGFGVYFGTELVAQASSLEEIPILMDKIANDRMEEANRQKEAEVTTQGADVQLSSLPIQNQVQSPTPTAAANSTVTATSTDLQSSSSPSPPPQAVVETPPPMENTENTPTGNEKKVEEGDNNSVASSKTAFEVWVGGKLVGIAKDKDELPIIVAAAKAQEKLKRKLVSSRSKKSIKSTGKSESKRRLQGSESSSTVLDSEQTPGEDGNGELNTESNEQNE